MRRMMMAVVLSLVASLVVAAPTTAEEPGPDLEHCELSIATGQRTCFESHDDLLDAVGLGAQRMAAGLAAGEDMSAALLEEGVIGLHFDFPNFDDGGGSLAITGTDCAGGGLSLDVAAPDWNNRISSTLNGCTLIQHYAAGDPIPNNSSADWTYLGVEPTELPNTSNTVSGIIYSSVTFSVNFVDAVPLLTAHGFTGNANDLAPAADLAEEVVSGLDIEDHDSPQLGGIDSIVANANVLVDEAEDLLVDSGTRRDRVNVLAHSKGGLDARLAFFLRPDLFDSLAMLSTPNGGSELAAYLCSVRRVWGIGGFVPIQSQMGDCDDEDDGLYNLHPDFVAGFNDLIIDFFQFQDFYVLGADCSLTSNACLAANVFNQCGVGGDGTVCLESMGALATSTPPRHQLVSPIYQTDHTGIRSHRCPVLRALYQMYAPHMQGLSGTFDNDCARGLTAELGSPLTGPAPIAPAASATPTATAVSQIDSLVVSSASDELAGPSGVVSIAIADQTALAVLTPASAAPSITAQTATGSEALTPTETLLGEARLLLVDVPPTTSTIEVTVADGVEVATIGYAQPTTSEPVLTASYTAGTVDITVDVDPTTAATTQVHGTVDGTGLVALTPDGSTPGRFSGSVAHAGTGSISFVQASVDGTTSRILEVPVDTETGAGSIGSVVSSGLIDVSGSGTNDSLGIDIDVSVDTGGDYALFGRLVDDATGEAVALRGIASLPAGSSDFVVWVPTAELAAAALTGPFTVQDLELTDADLATIVTKPGNAGAVGPVDLSGTVDETIVLDAQAEVTLAGSAPATIDVTVDLYAGQATPHVIAATIESPTGEILDTAETAVVTSEGPNTAILSFPIDVTENDGPGTYRIVDITVLNTADPGAYLSHPEIELAVNNYFCAGQLATIVGTSADDTLNGTAGVDVIVGLDGDDTILGGDGDDILCGNRGKDTIDGEAGNDVVKGNRGADTLNGGAGNDVVRGGRGSDDADGGDGDDEVRGGKGNDDLRGGTGVDMLIGGNGDDVIRGNEGTDTIFGKEGDDDLRGGKDADQIFGGRGDDTLTGGNGDDVLDGGNGSNAGDGGNGTDQCTNGTYQSCET